MMIHTPRSTKELTKRFQGQTGRFFSVAGSFHRKKKKKKSRDLSLMFEEAILKDVEAYQEEELRKNNWQEEESCSVSKWRDISAIKQ